MTTPPAERCENCRFWRHHPENKDAGECRRRTPVISGMGGTWPSTQPKDWCGEFEMRAEVKPVKNNPDEEPPCMLCGAPSFNKATIMLDGRPKTGLVCVECFNTH